MNKTNAIVVALLTFLICSAAQAGWTVTLLNNPLTDGLFMEDGVTGYQYIYEVVTDGSSGRYLGFHGFDGSQAAWIRTHPYYGVTGMWQRWDVNSADHSGEDPLETCSAAVNDGTGQGWTLATDAWGDFVPAGTTLPWAMDNVWNVPDDYAYAWEIYMPTTGYVDLTEGLSWDGIWGGGAFGTTAGIFMTIRIVHPGLPGDMVWDSDAGYSGMTTGPTATASDPGDFDGDGDVDVDDINALCANMTGDGIPLPAGFEQYDLDNDGDADSADMDILIHDLVETTVGIGTEYGDFNLDGKIDTVDLTILGTYFGIGTSWNQGNANCDTTVDTVDLTILGTYFGFVASSPIPEPATLALLAMAGAALLRRRKS